MRSSKEQLCPWKLHMLRLSIAAFNVLIVEALQHETLIACLKLH